MGDLVAALAAQVVPGAKASQESLAGTARMASTVSMGSQDPLAHQERWDQQVIWRCSEERSTGTPVSTQEVRRHEIQCAEEYDVWQGRQKERGAAGTTSEDNEGFHDSDG